MKNVLAVYNYNAGRKKALMHKKKLHKFLLKRCRKFKFISIDELSDEQIDDYDTVFAIGGDGTVNKCACAVLNSGSDAVLAVIPCGTADLLGAKLGFSADLTKTLKIIEQNNIKKIDVLEINGKYSILRCGFGFDSSIICSAPQKLKNKFGYFTYFIAGIIFAFRLKLKKYEIEYDGNRINTEASCVIAANAANMYRNIISIADNCRLDDGLADVFILKTKNPIVFFIEFLRILLGIKKSSSRAVYLKAREINIKNDWALCHIDGEKTKLQNDIKIKVLPQKIKVIMYNVTEKF